MGPGPTRRRRARPLTMSSLGLSKNPGAADLLECRLRDKVIKGWSDNVCVEPVGVCSVLESVAVWQDESEPEAEIGVGYGPDPSSNGRADDRLLVLGQAKLLECAQVGR